MIIVLNKPAPEGTPLISLVLAGETADKIEQILDRDGFRAAVNFVEHLIENKDLNAVMVCQHIQNTRYERSRQVPAPRIGDTVTIRYGIGPDETATGRLTTIYGDQCFVTDDNTGETYVGELESI